MIAFIKRWWAGSEIETVEKEAEEVRQIEEGSDVSDVDPNFTNRAYLAPEKSLSRPPSSNFSVRIDGSGLFAPRPGTL